MGPILKGENYKIYKQLRNPVLAGRGCWVTEVQHKVWAGPLYLDVLSSTDKRYSEAQHILNMPEALGSTPPPEKTDLTQMGQGGIQFQGNSN